MALFESDEPCKNTNPNLLAFYESCGFEIWMKHRTEKVWKAKKTTSFVSKFPSKLPKLQFKKKSIEVFNCCFQFKFLVETYN